MSSKKWYYNSNLKPQGPVSEELIRQMIHQGQIGADDLLLNEDEGQSWRPASEWRCFEARLFPANQSPLLQESYDIASKEWVLIRYEENRPVQDGPYSAVEVRDGLLKKHFSPETLAWKSGLSGWVQLRERSEFQVKKDNTEVKP